MPIASPPALRSNDVAVRAWRQRGASFPSRAMLPKIPSERARGSCSATMPVTQLPFRYALMACESVT